MFFVLLVLLLFCSVTSAADRSGNGVISYEDGSIYLQIYPFDPEKRPWLVVHCFDQTRKIETKLHVSIQHGITVFRNKVATFKTLQRPDCYVNYPDGSLSIFYGRAMSGVPHQTALPERIEYPPVTEITPESPFYTFSDAPLIKSHKYERYFKILTRTATDEGFRKANFDLLEKADIKVFLTLTTSPQRLPFLHYVLRSIGLDLVDEILVTLPRKFKDTQPYVIPKALKTAFPKITFISEERDFGPISKIASAVQFVYESEGAEVANEAIFISIDDDNFYSDRLVDTLVYHSIYNEESVIAASSLKFFPFSIFGQPFNAEIKSKMPHLTMEADVEGFAGVAYRGRHVDYKLMKFLADKQQNPKLTSCYFSDDVVISLVLMVRNVQILELPRETNHYFYSRNERYDFPHFRDENALVFSDVNGAKTDLRSHISRYQVCHCELMSYFVDYSSVNFANRQVPIY